MALNSLFCADVPLSNYSLTHSLTQWASGGWGAILLRIPFAWRNKVFWEQVNCNSACKLFLSLCLPSAPCNTVLCYFCISTFGICKTRNLQVKIWQIQPCGRIWSAFLVEQSKFPMSQGRPSYIVKERRCGRRGRVAFLMWLRILQVSFGAFTLSVWLQKLRACACPCACVNSACACVRACQWDWNQTAMALYHQSPRAV